MWEIDLSSQISTMVWSLVFGFAFCVVFDFISTAEEQFSFTKLGVFLTDILFFILIGFFDFCFFIATSNGEIRGFVFVGEVIGFFVCKKTLSRVYTPLLLILFKAIKTTVKVFYNRLILPISSFFEKIPKMCISFFQKTLQKRKKVLKK